jgi:thioester reductase-like protein
VFLSSLLVFGNARGPALEEELQVGQRFLDEYEESLAVAERIVQSMLGQRPVSILRTAPVAGDEKSGTLLPGSPLTRLVRTIEKAGDDKAFSFTDLPVRWDTVDRVSEALLALSSAPPDRVYHLADQDPLTDRQLVLWLSERFEKAIVESPAGARPWSGWAKAQFPGSRSVAGWGLHFQRQNAERSLGRLLDWDQAAVLDRLLTSEGAQDD